jgi:hypothetical protein
MDPLDIHGSIHGSMDVDAPLGSMDVDVTNIHGYPSSDFTVAKRSRHLYMNTPLEEWIKALLVLA